MADAMLSRVPKLEKWLKMSNRLTKKRATYHLHKFGVLYHHGMHDTQERFVTGEQTGTPCERVPLQHALTGMLGQHFDDATALGSRGNVPLEVPARVFALKDGVEFVRYEFIGREDTERLWVSVSNGRQNV